MELDERSARVNLIFNKVIGRDATPQERSRYRLLNDRMLIDMARSIEQDSKKNTESGKIKEQAMTCAKEFGVSLVSTYGSQCGIATYTENLYKELRKKGFRSNVISENNRNSSTGATEEGVVKSWSKDSPDFAERIIEQAARFGNKIIHIQHEFGLYKNNNSLSNMIGILKGSGFKVVLTLHTVRLEKHFDAYYRHADVLVVHSEFAAGRLYGGGVNNVTCIPHGTEEPIDIPRVHGIQYIHQFVPLTQDSIVCTYPGFISANKMQIEVIKAAKIACERNQKLRFLLIGSTTRGLQDVGYLEKLKEHETDRIKVVNRFLAPREMGLVLVGSDMAVMNYEQTHFSTSGMCHYLMTYEVPSITSISRILDDIGSDVSIKINRCNDVNEIAEAIYRLSIDESLRKQFKMALKNRRSATSWNVTANKHISVYSSIK